MSPSKQDFHLHRLDTTLYEEGCLKVCDIQFSQSKQIQILLEFRGTLQNYTFKAPPIIYSYPLLSFLQKSNPAMTCTPRIAGLWVRLFYDGWIARTNLAILFSIAPATLSMYRTLYPQVYPPPYPIPYHRLFPVRYLSKHYLPERSP